MWKDLQKKKKIIINDIVWSLLCLYYIDNEYKKSTVLFI